MLSLILLLIAPIFQIVLSVLRIKGRLSMSLIYIAGYALALGIGLTTLSVYIISDDTQANSVASRCGTIEAAFMFMGIFITIIFIPIIGLASYLYYRIDKQ